MSAHDDILDRLWAARPKVYTAICKDMAGEWDLRTEYVQVTPQPDREVDHQMAIQKAKESCAGAWERGVEYEVTQLRRQQDEALIHRLQTEVSCRTLRVHGIDHSPFVSQIRN